MVAVVVTMNDGFHLPPFQFVVELMATDTYFAHEQLKELVDGS
jgi:hypothetical protein